MALSQESTMGAEEKEIIEKLVKKLAIPQADVEQAKKDIYEAMLPYLEYEEWYVKWTSNSTLSASKIDDSAVQTIDLVIINKNRTTNITLVYFSKEQQMLMSTKQFVPASSDAALKHFKKRKANKAFVKKAETDDYAFFKKEGYASNVGYLIDDANALIIYFSTEIYTYGEAKK